MRYCSNCGSPNKDDAKFCYFCGNAFQLKTTITPPVQESSNRQVVYVGKVMKCPACGMEIDGTTAKCPACGHIIEKIVIDSSVEKFIENVNVLENKRIKANKEKMQTSIVIWSIVLSVVFFFTYMFLKTVAEDAMPSIQKFMFNTVIIAITTGIVFWAYISITKLKLSSDDNNEIEFLASVNLTYDKKTSLDTLYYIHGIIKGIKSRIRNAYNEYWMNVWRDKAKLIYSHAHQQIQGDTEIESAYKLICEDASGYKHNRKIKIYFFIAVIVVEIVAYLGSRFLPSTKSFNAIPSSRASFGYWLQDNFTVGDNGVSFEIINNKTIRCTYSVICNKALRTEIDQSLKEQGIDVESWDIVDGYMTLAPTNISHVEIGIGSVNQQNALAFANELINLNEGEETIISMDISPSEWNKQVIIRDCMNSVSVFYELKLDIRYKDVNGECGQIRIDYDGTIEPIDDSDN